MKYVSIDIETTGLNPERCDILSFGAVIEDTARPAVYDHVPKFYAVITQHEISGSPFAINLNKKIVEQIAAYQESNLPQRKALEEILLAECGPLTTGGYLHKDNVAVEFFKWLCTNDFYTNHDSNSEYGSKVPLITSATMPVSITVAGKNFGTFDKLFLERLPRWQQLIRVKQRMIDPAVALTDWENDSELPNLEKCKIRAGVSGSVTHNALADAWDVVMVTRALYSKK